MWIIRNNPTPGSLAERELNERRAAKGLPPVGKAAQEAAAKAEAEAARPQQTGQRQQPKRQPKKRRK